MEQKVVDFTWDPVNTNYIYVLNSESEVVLFELSQHRNTCKDKGRVILEKPGAGL